MPVSTRFRTFWETIAPMIGRARVRIRRRRSRRSEGMHPLTTLKIAWRAPSKAGMIGGMLARTLLTCVLLSAAPVAAQDMDQGEARITARSDVRMSVESAPGTSGVRFVALQQAMAGRMASVRQCYVE